MGSGQVAAWTIVKLQHRQWSCSSMNDGQFAACTRSSCSMYHDHVAAWTMVKLQYAPWSSNNIDNGQVAALTIVKLCSMDHVQVV